MGLCASSSKGQKAVHPEGANGSSREGESAEKLVYKHQTEQDESKGGRSKGSLFRGASARMRQQYENERERRRSTRRTLRVDGSSLESWHSLGAEYTEDARRRVRRAIKGNALFQHLPDRAVDAIFSEMVPLSVEAETMVFQTDEEAQMFYVVDSGRFASGDESGNKLEEFQEGDAIGEESLLAQARRTYNVVALTAGRLWAMDSLKYQQVLVASSKRQAAQTISSLQNVPILQALTKAQLEILQEAFTKVTYDPDTRILTEGEQGDTFFIIQEGHVECRHSADAEGSRCRVLGPGDYFGEGALLTKKPRSMNVTAVDRVRCLVLDLETFQQTLQPVQELLSHGFFVRVLSSIPLFESLSLDELEQVSGNMELKTYNDAEPIIRQGERGTKMFIIKEGRVRVMRRGGSNCSEGGEGGSGEGEASPGAVEEMGVMVSGDYFGEGGFLTGEVRTASCIASGPKTVCAVLDREAFGEVLNSLEPALAQQFAVRQSLWESPEEEEATIGVGDLEVVARLGAGNFGAVDIVRHRVTGRTYALKKMVKRMIEKRGIQKYVVNERYILSRIRCPFIVRLHRTFRTKRHVYFLMDLLIGGELQPHIMNPKGLTPRSTRFYAANVALALIYMHERGVVHRDLKGENVMIHQGGYLKLVDFGMATRLKKGQRAHTMCGTPEYVAPEVMTQGSGVGYSVAVDWWSFGVIVGMMMTKGKHPLNIPLHCSLPKAWKVLVRYVKHYPEWPSLRMPDVDAQDFVTRLLHPNPARRLGMGKRGARGIMKHPFFAGVDWEKLANRSVEPPYIPEVSDLLDLSNFGGGAAQRAVQSFQDLGHDSKSVISDLEETEDRRAWDAAF